MNRSGVIARAVLGRLEQRDLLVDELARRAALVDGGLGDVDRVLVGAGQEPRVVAEHPVPARDRVGADDLVQGVEARLVVGVRDRRGQVVAGSVGHGRRMVAGRPSRPAPVTVRPMPEHDAATRRSIAVIGAGYVGLVSAVGLAAMGHRDRARRDRSRPPRRPPRAAASRSPSAGVQEALERGARLRRPDGPRPRLEARPPRSSSICVGTPIDDSGHADVGAVEAVLAELAGRERRADRRRPQHDAGRDLRSGCCATATSATSRGSSPSPSSCARDRRSPTSPTPTPRRHRMRRRRGSGAPRRSWSRCSGLRRARSGWSRSRRPS